MNAMGDGMDKRPSVLNECVVVEQLDLATSKTLSCASLIVCECNC